MIELIKEKIAHEQTKVELYKAQFQMLDVLGRQSMATIEMLTAQINELESNGNDLSTPG